LRQLETNPEVDKQDKAKTFQTNRREFIEDGKLLSRGALNTLERVIWKEL
jgi:hypothetical protein